MATVVNNTKAKISMEKDEYIYFLYSEYQHKERIKIEASINRIFTPGTVIVRGKPELYTEMSIKPKNTFIDCKIIAEGMRSTMKFTPITSRNK